jgi:hypothetical protein
LKLASLLKKRSLKPEQQTASSIDKVSFKKLKKNPTMVTHNQHSQRQEELTRLMIQSMQDMGYT